MKKLSFALSALFLLSSLSQPVQAATGVGGTRETPVETSVEQGYETRAYRHSYYKTITQYYPAYQYYGNLPQYRYYSEYNSSFHAHFGGYLRITSVRYTNGGFVVTYAGTISGFWN